MIKIIKSEEFDFAHTIYSTVPAAVRATVSEVIADVSIHGDAALREYTELFDGCRLCNFELPPSALDEAVSKVGPEFYGTMQRAAKNIEEFHRHQISQGFEMAPCSGVVLGQRIIPLKRVGLYIPGGTAAYPSSVLMNCIPAKLAGVEELIIATPPSREGRENTGILAAAKIAGADRVFTIGGAQAIAALAYGTETVPRVDKITGPGNAYVAEAKRQVFGVVGIDMIAGPSDVLVIADVKANPKYIAADMLSQCEHGEDSSAILVTDSGELAIQVSAEIEKQLMELPREETAREAVENNSKIIIVESLEQAFDISNELAPEHLEIFLENPRSYLDKVRNAGSVFLGQNTPEVLGDYFAGPNHTLPTSGTARFTSPLSVDDFIKKVSYTQYSGEALRHVSDDVIRFAKKEGLTAHAQSVVKRLTNS